MANLKDLIVNGSARVIGNLYANLFGNAETATKLQTGRAIKTNLASTSAANFDGSADITPGIQGTLPVANGGTGQTSIANIKAGKDANGNVIADTYATKAELTISNGGVSNCITKIAQDVNIELSDGILTIKTGSTYYTPDGSQYQLTSDKTRQVISSSHAFVVILLNMSDNSFNQIYEIDNDKTCSGSTDTLDGTPRHLWYDTTNNLIKYIGNDGTTVSYYAALPLCLASGNGSSVQSIDLVFNGLGFIGHHAFMLPGLEGLIANGFNTDGTLKSTLRKNTALRIVELTSAHNTVFLTNWSTYISKAIYGGEFYTTNDMPADGSYCYIKDNNAIYRISSGTLSGIQPIVPAATYTYNGTNITKFEVRQPVRLTPTETTENIVQNQGTFLPNFDLMRVIETHEFDVSDTTRRMLFTRTNTETAEKDLTDIVYCRITITGTNISAVHDCAFIWKAQMSVPCYMFVLNKPGTADTAKTGIRILRNCYPKALNNGYPWIVDFYQENTTARHYKVEVFKTNKKITWVNGTTTTYNSTYHNTSEVTLRTNRGYCFSDTIYMNASQASWGSGINGWLNKFLNTNVTTGEAILANQFVYMYNKALYPATTKTNALEPGFGIQLTNTAYSASNSVDWAKIRSKTRVTSISNIPHDTLTAGDPCYFRCTTDDSGNIFSDNYVATSMTAGYTWYYVGMAESSSVIAVDTVSSKFLTLDSSGNLIRIDGKGIATATGGSSNTLLDFKWSDHILNDASWLRADTWSWQDGAVYTTAYNFLKTEYLGGTSTSETVAGFTIPYKLAENGMKIVDTTNAGTVQDILDVCGVAWYYIIDTTNERFKLPRTKYGFMGLRDAAGNYTPESLPQHTHDYLEWGRVSGTNLGYDTNNHKVYYEETLTTGEANNPIYQTDAPVQQRGTQMYLYFYVGNTIRNQTEVDVGEITDALNNKWDSSNMVVTTTLPANPQTGVFYFIK